MNERRSNDETTREAWSGGAVAKLTLSLPKRRAAERAARAAERAIMEAGSGFTRTRARGGWRGSIENAHAIEIVGSSSEDLAPIIDAAARAAIARGCSAIQCEIRDGSSYRVVELRR
jgi:hypothetical protein